MGAIYHLEDERLAFWGLALSFNKYLPYPLCCKYKISSKREYIKNSKS